MIYNNIPSAYEDKHMKHSCFFFFEDLGESIVSSLDQPKYGVLKYKCFAYTTTLSQLQHYYVSVLTTKL